MTFVESPAIGDGLGVWIAWRQELQARKSTCRDKIFREELARAEAIIKIFEQYPDGVDPKSVEFRKALKEYTTLLSTR